MRRARSFETQIGRMAVSAYTIPTSSPEADGTFAWDKTTTVIVELTAAGVTGLGYTYGDVATAVLIDHTFRRYVEGADAMATEALWARLVYAIRNLGRPGICSMAIAAVDCAAWDLKARLLEQPLARLLGLARTSVDAYGSGGFTSYSLAQLQQQLGGWTADGFGSVKMKIGTHPERDIERVRAARDAIGPSVQLYVDANGAYSRKQALWFAEAFADLGVRWFEEPVSSDDLTGLRLIRDRAPAVMEIAAGEYGYDAHYFRRMLEAEAVDVQQADATRCAGPTGFMRAAALCEAFSTPLSAHTAPSLHAHLCCAASRARNIEYFHDHARIEQMLFDGAIKARAGKLSPDLSRPGLGLELKRSAARKYEVYRSKA
jgi:L-alanine-DL-glutamate epimerase-like enolase superfamily enzyme